LFFLTSNLLFILTKIKSEKSTFVFKSLENNLNINQNTTYNSDLYFHETITLCNELAYLSVVLCLISQRSFDGVAAIDDSNWYIKRLNYINKNALFWSVKSLFSTPSPRTVSGLTCLTVSLRWTWSIANQHRRSSVNVALHQDNTSSTPW
jgi:hypothetical protein